MKIFKFGGASVKDAEAVKNVCKIISMDPGTPLLVVISAMGKMTNALEEVWRAYINKDDSVHEKVSLVVDFHTKMINELFDSSHQEIRNDISNLFVELEWALEEEQHEDRDFSYDQMVSLGELLSTKIVEAYIRSQGINSQWIDARGYIQTDNTYREANIDWEKTSEFIQRDLVDVLQNKTIITQGFIAGTSENFTTTLGREGSDYSAAIFANVLNAESVTIWKDVPGVLTADPKLFNDAVIIPDLPYSEALEMTYYGATVIHPKTIKPLQNKKIPMFVKPFLSPEERGTSIGLKDNIAFENPIIILKKQQLLLSISTLNFSFIAEENLSEIIGMIAKHRVKINTMQNSAMTFSCCIDDDGDKSASLIKALSNQYKVFYNEGLELTTIRHHNESVIKQLTNGKQILMEQRSRGTIQLVMRNIR